MGEEQSRARREAKGQGGAMSGLAYRLFGIAPIAVAVKAEEMSARM
jgi:hypothetical protein